VRFARRGRAAAAARWRRRRRDVEVGGEDPPDPIVDGKIDLGALAADSLRSASIPIRASRVAFDAPETQGGRDSPFAALAKPKTKR